MIVNNISNQAANIPQISLSKYLSVLFIYSIAMVIL